jgi:hypothetical protein
MSDGRPQTPSRGALLRPFLDPGGDSRPDDGPPDAAAPPREAPHAGVRPFLLTSGRTAAAEDLPVETQIVVTTKGRAASGLSFEYRDIVALCADPIAVAELAARLGLHLGVVRVLVGDLRAEGLVTTYPPSPDSADDVGTIVRVIRGLRRLG